MREMSDALVATEPLCQVADAFRTLVDRSQPLTLDVGGVHPSLPKGPLDVIVLRSLLLHPSLGHTVRGLVWERLLELTSRPGVEGEDWGLAVVGIAWPGLRAVVDRLQEQVGRELRWELAQVVLAGFWQALVRIRAERAAGAGGQACKIPANLLWAAERAGRRFRADAEKAEKTASRSLPLEFGPQGEPAAVVGVDLLELAVARGVLDREQAELVASSRIDRRPMRELAVHAGLTPEAVGMRRVRAERLLVQALKDGLLGPVGPDGAEAVR
jgi:hypothetical protein